MEVSFLKSPLDSRIAVMSSIFITGGTGFVGSNFIKNLDLSLTEKIYILVRSVEKYKILKSKLPMVFHTKLIPIIGSINDNGFSISESGLDYIKRKVSAIYHIAAEVNHIKSYDQLYDSNVRSLDTLFEISSENNSIINFVSTLGAARNDTKGRVVKEDFLSNGQPELSMGYLSSKQQAEVKLAEEYNKSRVNIFRLGYVSGHSLTGEGLYQNNQLMLFIKSCIQMGYAPDLERLINLTPVDFVGKFMSLPNFINSGGNVFNLFNYTELITWHDLIEYLNRIGYSIDIINMSHWQSLLKRSGKENALFRMLLLYRRKDAKEKVLQFGTNITDYCYRNTERICQRYHIQPPALKYDYLNTLFRYLTQVGFLNENT